MEPFRRLLLTITVMGVIVGLPPEIRAAIIKVPKDYPTIQDAVDAGQPGDTIVVRPGKHNGAVVTKRLNIQGGFGQGKKTIINGGPQSHPDWKPELRAGFLFPGGSGGGTTITGFTFDCGQLPGGGLLAFAVFSRGADNVSIIGNVINNPVQGITNWHGSNWSIKHNKILEQRALVGGGIGILIGSFNGGHANQNKVINNYIVGSPQAEPTVGPYTTPAILLMSDTRFGRSGGPIINNSILNNQCEVASESGVGIELSDLNVEGRADVSGNGVNCNIISYCACGVTLYGVGDNTVAWNAIRFSSQNGILGTCYPEGKFSFSNFISSNLVLDSQVNGIYMDEGSFINHIRRNNVEGSGECDLKDSGTGNDWRGNYYETACGNLATKQVLKPHDQSSVPSDEDLRRMVVASPFQ